MLKQCITVIITLKVMEEGTISLKHFHLVFITLSIICTIFTGVWAQNQSYFISAILCYAVAVGLLMYEVLFIRKTKILTLILPVLFIPHISEACSVCFAGDSSDPSIKGLQAGIFLLIGVLIVVFACFITFFINFSRRAKAE